MACEDPALVTYFCLSPLQKGPMTFNKVSQSVGSIQTMGLKTLYCRTVMPKQRKREEKKEQGGEEGKVFSVFKD